MQILQKQMESPDIYLNVLPPGYPLREMASFFEHTLHAPKHTVGDQQILAQPVNPSKNTTIIMDVQRTRASYLPKYLKPQMQKILVHFCRMQKLQYKQGMNQILAPFIYFRQAGLSVSQCYGLFRQFFDQYCLNFYYDKDFNSLEVIFKMITVMIKYHDPALARYLQNYEIEPQIYCISWLMTLFSSKLSLELTYTLWQLIAVQKDDYLIFFLIIAIILNRRESIIQTKMCSIFSIITNLIFKDEQQLRNTIKIALLLRKTTPNSLILFFREHAIFKQRQSFDKTHQLLNKMDKLNLFLVGPLEVSLKQHFKLGMCQKKCYFCSLRQPLKVHHPQTLMPTFPLFAKLVSLSNDIRTMEHSLDFIVIDVRKDKSKKLPRIEGLTVFPIDTSELIQDIQARFNEEFIELRGREHFLFLLNNFSFENQESFESQEFFFCNQMIKILNSYSYCYLSILEGGEAAYSLFVKQLHLKSQLLNSKIIPVSEYIEQVNEGEEYETVGVVGREGRLQLSQIVALRQLFQTEQLFIFEGQQNSQDEFLFVLKGLVLWVQRNGMLQRLVKFIHQRKSLMTHMIEEIYITDIPFRIICMHSLFRMQKLTARVHHNNCLLFYIQEYPHESKKKYRRGARKELWSLSLRDIVEEDLRVEGSCQIKRLGFDSASFDMVKTIAVKIKAFYKKVLRVSAEIRDQDNRRQQLNKNIFEDFDFSRKEHFDEINATTNLEL